MNAQRTRVQRPRILVIVATTMTVRAFLLDYLRALSENHDVTLVCSGDDPGIAKDLPQGVIFHPIDVRRSVHVPSDLKALAKLISLMRSQHFDMVHSVTPKAGLLAQIAARICGIGVRVHTFTGQVWATKTGAARLFLKALDRLLAACATHLLADSASQRDFLIAEGVTRPAKITVLADGSISGVDGKRFKSDAETRNAVRSRLGYSDADVLALFVGRLNRDKGVLDLVAAFSKASERVPNLALLLVGPDEANLEQEINALAGDNSRMRLLGGTPVPESFMAAADFFCLPSYREGFGTVVIEAAACGLPALASAIYGLTDAVEDGVTGLLHAPGDISAISALLERFCRETAWRQQLGRQAQERALTRFATGTVTAAQMRFVSSLLEPNE
jgi:glycosyltransferase involved in cell wall biosynthesis